MFTSVIFSKTLFDALQTIDLSDNNLTQVAGKILAEHLPKYPQLETLMYAIVQYLLSSEYSTSISINLRNAMSVH